MDEIEISSTHLCRWKFAVSVGELQHPACPHASYRRRRWMGVVCAVCTVAEAGRGRTEVSALGVVQQAGSRSRSAAAGLRVGGVHRRQLDASSDTSRTPAATLTALARSTASVSRSILRRPQSDRSELSTELSKDGNGEG